MRLLANDPSLAPNAFEESLRHMGPVLMLQRKTTREVDIAGLTLPEETIVASLPIAFARRSRPVAAIPPQESGVSTVASLGQKLDLSSLIRRQPQGTHLYVCGPEGLMAEAIEIAEDLGWPAEAIHFERFGAPVVKGDAPFTVTAERSGKTLEVGANGTILDSLEQAGIKVPFACRAGSCGSCETRVVSGTPIYRNSIQTPAERAGGTEMMVCVDRATGPLTLDV